jgi:hypothetical protein
MGPGSNPHPATARPAPTGEPEAGTILIVAPAALLHPTVPQPAGRLAYQLLTGRPECEPGELVFVADLMFILRARVESPSSFPLRAEVRVTTDISLGLSAAGQPSCRATGRSRDDLSLAVGDAGRIRQRRDDSGHP